MCTFRSSNETHVTVMHKREKVDQNLSKTLFEKPTDITFRHRYGKMA